MYVFQNLRPLLFDVEGITKSNLADMLDFPVEGEVGKAPCTAPRVMERGNVISRFRSGQGPRAKSDVYAKQIAAVTWLRDALNEVSFGVESGAPFDPKFEGGSYICLLFISTIANDRWFEVKGRFPNGAGLIPLSMQFGNFK